MLMIDKLVELELGPGVIRRSVGCGALTCRWPRCGSRAFFGLLRPEDAGSVAGSASKRLAQRDQWGHIEVHAIDADPHDRPRLGHVGPH